MNSFKEYIKNLAHNTSFIPYRKPSKRYKSWNYKREESFILDLKRLISVNPIKFDSVFVSIVMPCYNRAYCIGNAIDSVFKQTHTNWELLIIDDGSTDNLNDVIAPYLKDERVKVERIERSGVSKARNVGLANAKGVFVFYLDTDNKWFDNYLKYLTAFMIHNDLYAAYSGVKIVDDKMNILGYYGEPFSWNECLEMNYIDINSFAHRNPVPANDFKFDESLKRLVDWDFILSITKNKRTAYAPFLGVEYYDGQQGDRITFTEHVGDEIKEVISLIQKKNKPLSY